MTTFAACAARRLPTARPLLPPCPGRGHPGSQFPPDQDPGLFPLQDEADAEVHEPRHARVDDPVQHALTVAARVHDALIGETLLSVGAPRIVSDGARQSRQTGANLDSAVPRPADRRGDGPSHLQDRLLPPLLRSEACGWQPLGWPDRCRVSRGGAGRWGSGQHAHAQ